MKSKFWSKVLNSIIGPTTDRFEDRFLLTTCLFLFIIYLLSLITVVLLNLNQSIVILTFLGIFVFLFLYFFGRFVNRNHIFFWLAFTLMMLFFDLNWLCNYGSNGPILPQFIAFYAFLILVFDKRNLLIVSIILYLNIIVLFLFELFFSQKLGEYENSTIRIYDVYGGIIFSLLVIFFFVQGIKKKYIEEYIKAKKSDQLKSAFISNMSHEIRTPLNAIVGFSSLIVNAENYTAEEKKMFNNQIQLNSDYLLKLIDDIIDVSKIELTQLTVNYKKIQICQLMHQLREMFLISLPEGKNLDIIINSCCEGKIIEVDPLRLEQILRNLISNAIKFTTSGKIELGCSTDAKFYIFFVKDTGIGILPENQQIIFDRFVKIDNKNQPFQQGTGLGLYLSKQLVTIFGGKIWVESVFGKGSCFYFTLPIKHDKD